MNFAFVFPGQGSQSVGMMAAYGESAVVRQAFAEASDSGCYSNGGASR